MQTTNFPKLTRFDATKEKGVEPNGEETVEGERVA
jgi:hypothetical protein